MRKIEFNPAAGSLKVSVDGAAIPGASLDLAAISAAKRSPAATPAMKEQFLRNLRRKLEDNGPNLRADEMRVVMGRFERAFDDA